MPTGTPDTERFIRSRVYLHALGTPPESDKAVFGFEVSPAISVPDEVFPAVFSPHDGGYVFAIMAHGVQRELTVYAAPRAAVAGEKTPWKKIVDRADEVVDLDVHGSDLYLLSLHGAPRSAVVRTPLAKPDVAHATVVIAAGEQVLQGFTLARDALYVGALDGGVGHILRAPFDEGAAESIALPIQGAVRTLAADPAADGALFALTGWTASRVSPWQAAKMTARLQAATGSGKPVLLRGDYEAGHGIGSSRAEPSRAQAEAEAERADKYAFLLDQLDETKRVAPSR